MKAAMEGVLKELQWFPDDIRKKMDEVSERGGGRYNIVPTTDSGNREWH